jgi:acyl-CoA synthetase (AMP-forming)/AMP-acid ligase II/acyl carrier protein
MAVTPTFADRLEHYGDRPALLTPDGGTVTYAGLARRADEWAEAKAKAKADADDDAGRLAGRRRLVVLEAANDLPSVVAYLACLRHRHPVVVVPAGRSAAITETFDPDVVVVNGVATHRTTATATATAPTLHDDLAVLLSTSGSTGSPKLVRLSHRNLDANAAAIADSLGLGPDDRAVTSLPMAYCYGLSVLHSHLAVGASVLLSERSVTEEAFWDDVAAHGVTTFAGVPHTFALLDRTGFEARHLPSLRTVTEAGGRLAPEAVVRYARLGRRRGWRFVVMYGQTEATARMAYLPPALTERHPGAIGRAVDGGELRLDDVDDDGVGELVYRGPNVMLGYATTPADLALGRTVHELRTGDLGRRIGIEGGLFEVVGRRSRFVKPFGLRIDLDTLERALADAGLEALCAGDDERGVAVAVTGDEVRAAALVQERTGLPPANVVARRLESLPRLENGKPDHGAVAALLLRDDDGERPPADTRASATRSSTTVAALFAAAFGGPAVAVDGADTFTSIGGDSLSYVELSVRLEELLGSLPDDWPDRTVAELQARADATAANRTGDAAPAATARVETTVVLRAAAIVLVVATHAGALTMKGGAHLLLAIAGWNFARFQLPLDGRRLLESLQRVVVPSVAWLALLFVVSDDYGVANLLLVHTQTGSPVWDQRWRYWFVEALVQILLVAGAALSVPAVRRWERQQPFVVPAVALAATVVLREVADHHRTFHRPQTVAWLFVLGWLAQRATTPAHKVAVALAAVGTVHGFFHQPLREAVVIVGVALLLWCRTLPVPRALARPVATVAASSLTLYLVHWQVYPLVRPWGGSIVAVVASLASGIGLRWAASVIRTNRPSVEAGRSALARWARDERGAHAAA